MTNFQLFEKAMSCNGCLAKLRTKVGRRRYSQEEYDLDIIQIGDCFVEDEVKILTSKAFRNITNKTQATVQPINSLIRTRMTHTQEVVGCSVIISEMLGLNTSLARAIALGHDIGHVPFGHQGEQFIIREMGRPEFCHEIMGCVVAQKIERRGRGLNLTRETLEGILRHSANKTTAEMSPESWIVRYADKFAYIFHDFNDFQRIGYYSIPNELTKLMNDFGENQRERTSKAISSLVIESCQEGKVQFEKSDLARKFKKIRTLMYQIYPRIVQQNTDNLMGPALNFLQGLKHGDPFMLLALMTDRDVINLANQPVRNLEQLRQTSIFEILPYLDEIGKIDLCNPDLEW